MFYALMNYVVKSLVGMTLSEGTYIFFFSFSIISIVKLQIFIFTNIYNVLQIIMHVTDFR